ncbi:MAG TPA: hypothetical protein GX693_05710 [Firmicutes bacterium]|nr:hypothetical protein [Bacillota bacterium]
MKLEGNCQTTAMGILPHTDVERALQLALSLDIPFWPQLPRINFFEDMYAQISEHFPGITLDLEQRMVRFSLERFYKDLEKVISQWDNEEYFSLSPRYSAVFHRFLEKDLTGYRYIRGQSIGPVSYGLKILDEHNRPIIYHEEVRQVIFEFIAKKLQAQYNDLRRNHRGAFVWVDEPGLEMIFMAFTGYTDKKAKEDYRLFLNSFPGARGVHLCGNPDWSFLLELPLDILSLDVLARGHIFSLYTESIKEFLGRGGIISWGITPTLTEELQQESINTMINILNKIWGSLEQSGIPRRQILSQAWLAPARCCLVNLDGEKTIENSFILLQEVAEHFKREI